MSCNENGYLINNLAAVFQESMDVDHS